MNYEAILFDLDGTVLNTNELILQTFDYTFSTILHRHIPRAQLIQTFGQPLDEVMAEIDAAQADLLLRTYRQHNALIHDQWVTIFPNVQETFAALKNLGLKLAIVTSKKTDIARHGLTLFALDQYLDVFVGHEDTLSHKPNPEPALEALALLKIAPEKAIMVGDSPFDLLCGRRAGTKTAGVNYSALGAEQLLTYQPDFMLDTLADLLPIVQCSTK